MSSIPASEIVSVLPGVISAGGRALDLSGLLLTNSGRVPIGQVLSFATADTVADYFGPSSTEAALAAVYFGGYTNSLAKPGSMLLAQYPTAAVAAFLRGASVASYTLAQLQALSGTLTVTVSGVVKTSAAISLSGASSFSNAATLIQAGFTSPGFTVTYDSIAGAFLFTNTATGDTSTLTYASGTLAAGLKLTQATGAVLSQGALAATPAAFMSGIVARTQNWASFTTSFDPDAGSGNTEKQEFASWNSSRNNRYLYVAWDTDVTPTLSAPAAASLGALLEASDTSGTMVYYAPDATKAAFILGAVASLDFTKTNGRATMAFRAQGGLTADVTDATVAANLKANGYNFYGAYATANDEFTFTYPGSVSGPFKWADSYVNQIWLNNGLQLALMTLLTEMGTIPYNQAGYAAIEAACADPIQAALNFGAIRPGVPLSALQIAQVNSLAGDKVDTVLSTRGYYLKVGPASATVRAARASPPIILFYMDGQSVQQINMNSIEVL